MEQKPLVIRNNQIPQVDMDSVNEVHVWGWCDDDTKKFLAEALARHKKAIRYLDEEARASQESMTSIDERPVNRRT